MPESIILLFGGFGAFLLLLAAVGGGKLNVFGIEIDVPPLSRWIRFAVLAGGVLFIVVSLKLHLSDLDKAEDSSDSPSSPPTVITSVSPASPVPSSTSSPGVSNPGENGSQFLFVHVDAPSGTFKFAGSTALAALLCAPENDTDPGSRGIHAQIERGVRTNFNLDYQSPAEGEPSSTKGIEMLRRGEVDFVISSRFLNSDEEGVQQDDQGKSYELKQEKVAEYPLAFSVNPSVGVSSIGGLTEEQLVRVFGNPAQLSRVLGTGQSATPITNWEQVGGADQVITPYVHQAELDSLSFYSFRRNILKGIEFTNVTSVPTTTIGLKEVAINPGGIYRAPAPLSFGQQTVKTIPIQDSSNSPQSPYTDPSFYPVGNCRTLTEQAQISPEPADYTNPKYHENLWEPLYVIYKDYLNDNSDSRERAGKAYAALLMTDQGQDLLKYIGFKSVQ